MTIAFHEENSRLKYHERQRPFRLGAQKALDRGATAAVNSRSSTDAIEEVMEETGRRGRGRCAGGRGPAVHLRAVPGAPGAARCRFRLDGFRFQTGHSGVDVALEAVGLPSTFELCQARPAQLPGPECHE